MSVSGVLTVKMLAVYTEIVGEFVEPVSVALCGVESKFVP